MEDNKLIITDNLPVVNKRLAGLPGRFSFGARERIWPPFISQTG
jgi:hypothetical protein